MGHVPSIFSIVMLEKNRGYHVPMTTNGARAVSETGHKMSIFGSCGMDTPQKIGGGFHKTKDGIKTSLITWVSQISYEWLQSPPFHGFHGSYFPRLRCSGAKHGAIAVSGHFSAGRPARRWKLQGVVSVEEFSPARREARRSRGAVPAKPRQILLLMMMMIFISHCIIIDIHYIHDYDYNDI